MIKNELLMPIQANVLVFSGAFVSFFGSTLKLRFCYYILWRVLIFSLGVPLMFRTVTVESHTHQTHLRTYFFFLQILDEKVRYLEGAIANPLS
jgi:hypothetical protein